MDDLFSSIHDWTVQIDGKLTFFGVLSEHWDYISRNWKAESTQKTYIRDYDRYLLPNLDTVPLETLFREDFDRVIELVPQKKKEDGMVCNEHIIRHMRHLIKKVLEAADRFGVCPDCLWGTNYEISETADDDTLNKKELVLLRKSLTITEEIDIADCLLEDPKQPSENFGLALMFCLGVRNNEACGADFGDIHPMETDPSILTLWIYKSTEIGTNKVKFGGKTRNVSRIIPIPEKLKTLLVKRMEFLRETLRQRPEYQSGTQTDKDLTSTLEAMPIAGMGDDYSTRCSSAALTKAGMLLFKRVQLSQELLALIDRDIRVPGRTEEGIAEKDPTAYLFRRNLGTQLYLLGLNDNEIQYILGHDIEDENDSRSFYRNEEKLYPIAKKMQLRPVVNPIHDAPEYRMDVDTFALSDVAGGSLRIPIQKKERLLMILKMREPRGAVRVQIYKKNVTVKGEYIQIPNLDDYANTLSISDVYHERYRKVIHRNKI